MKGKYLQIDPRTQAQSYSRSSSDSSASSSSSSSSYSYQYASAAQVEVLRCSRCAKSVELISSDDALSCGMVRFGHNLYYCERCAAMVGYGQ